jgi:hypothetical protein
MVEPESEDRSPGMFRTSTSPCEVHPVRQLQGLGAVFEPNWTTVILRQSRVLVRSKAVSSAAMGVNDDLVFL